MPEPSRSRRGWLPSTVARLPAVQMQALGRLLGGLLYVGGHSLRRIGRRNLQFIHPEWSRGEVRQFLKQVFRHFGLTLVEVLQMSCQSRQEWRQRIWIQGLNHLQQALKGGHGAIIFSGHLGNWEIAWQFYPLYFGKPMLGVAKPFKIRRFNQWLHNARTRFGNHIIYKKGALPELRQALRQGRVVGFLIDMTRHKDGIPVKFFGRDATATPAAALLALRCQSPVIPAFCHRQKDGVLSLRFEAPIPIRKTKSLRDDLSFNTQLMTNIIEQAVRQHPEQWLWMQKRWKSFYPHLYPEYFTARKRRKHAKHP